MKILVFEPALSQEKLNDDDAFVKSVRKCAREMKKIRRVTEVL